MAAMISAIAGCGQFGNTTVEKNQKEPARTVAESDLPRVDGVTADGQDGDWSDQGLQLNALAGDTPTPLPSRDFDAIARLGWTDKGLAVLVEVRDNEFREEPRPSDIFKGDSIEMFLNSKPEYKGSLQPIVSPGLDPKFPELRYYIWDIRPDELKASTQPTFEACRTRTTDGYCMEAIIPWSNLGITPEVGTKVAFRLNVNDLDGQGSRRQFVWSSDGEPWHILKLADNPSPPVDVAAWAMYDRLLTTRVNVIATADNVGKSIGVSSYSKGKLLKSEIAGGELKADGRIAVASLEFTAPVLGEPAFDELVVSIGGKIIARLPMADIHKTRLNAVRSGIAGRGRRTSDSEWQQVSFACPSFKTYVLDGAELPDLEFGDPEMVRRLVGPFTIETNFYDADFNNVSSAEKPGRLGAISKISLANSETFTVNHTFYRLASEAVSSGTNESQAILFASGQSDKYLAGLANDKWWHELQRKLGTATRYEYEVFLPKDYEADPEKRWPLVLYLHGSGGHKNKAYAKDAKVLADMRPDVIVVAASSGGPSWRWTPLADLLDEVEKTYRVDADRVYLTGFSMGGYGTWHTVLAMPQRFAAIAPVGGGAGTPEQAARIKNIPAWVLNGEKDTTTTVEQAQKMVDALKGVGASVQFTIIPGADHVGSLRQAYRMPELYEWMLEQTRPHALQAMPTPRPD